MKKSAEFIKERAALIEAQKRMHEAAEKESRSLNEEETKEFRNLQGQIEALNEKIKDATAYEDNLRSLAGAAPSASAEGTGEHRETDKMMERYSVHKALRSQLPNNKLEGVELEVHQEIAKRAKDAGIALEGVGIPTSMRKDLATGEKRFAGQSVTQDSGEYGAALVATSIVGRSPPTAAHRPLEVDTRSLRPF